MKALLHVLFWVNVVFVPLDLVCLFSTGDWTWIFNVAMNAGAAWVVGYLNPEFVPGWMKRALA